MQVHNWQGIEKEQLNPLYTRQVIHSDTMTVVRVHFKKGCEVAEHSHPNEQVSMVEQGALKFVMDGVEHVVKSGEIMRVPPSVVHSVQAIDDCVMVEVFSPRRQDWIDASRANLRK